MTEQEVLQKAIEDYPLGTVYTPLGIDGTSASYHFKEGTVNKTPMFRKTGGLLLDAGLGYIYVNGKWAEICFTELDLARKIIYED